MKEKSKLAARKFRILRLLVTVQAYSAYRMMNLDREAMSIENNWQDAERLQQSFSAIFPYSNTSIESFIHYKQELADEALQYYDKFKYWVHIAESVCITETALSAFCKNVESGSSVYWLKCFGYLYYGDWLISLLLYLNKELTKEQLHANLVEYSLFTGKSNPANMAHFRKNMVEIETVINEIHCKQLNRRIKTFQIF
ncbi:MAG: hypothetical protein LBE13_06875 [Bacteroidales bacterium]|jgi:hypothetical protein|nr:hypothetical protein [Bacteroidales bacterium]